MTREAHEKDVAALVERAAVTDLLNVIGDHGANSPALLTTTTTLFDDGASEVGPFLCLVE
jgi:hypothetical protein